MIQISVDIQPNNKTAQLSNGEENSIKSLLQCEINFFQLKSRIDNPTGQNKEQCVPNL